MDAVGKAWVAGFFDGEGCVRIDLREERRNRKSNTLACRITVTNTDLSALESLWVAYNGSLKERKAREGHRPCYVWEVCGEASEVFVRDILPYSRTKRRQLELYLQARSLMAKPHELQKPLSAEKTHQRFAVAAEATSLRRSGG